MLECDLEEVVPKKLVEKPEETQFTNKSASHWESRATCDLMNNNVDP
jgi:hypothetical protein